MATITFNAYQIDLHYVVNKGGKDFDTHTWSDADFIESVQRIYALPLQQKQHKQNGWFVLLDDLNVTPEFLYGRFKYAEYGSKSDLIHADTLVSRNNPRDIREGEEQFLYFLVRRVDGLMLLQGHRRFTHQKFADYVYELDKQNWGSKQYTSLIAAVLLDLDFFEKIMDLDKVTGVVLEISRKVSRTDDNEVIQALQNPISEIEGTHVDLRFKAKYQRSGLTGVLAFIQKYRGLSGITNIKIEGKKSDSVHNISLNGYREKYSNKCETDENNLPIRDRVYDILFKIGNTRPIIPRREAR